jgi:uncharacterized protein
MPGMKEMLTVYHLTTAMVPLIDILTCGMLERFPRLRLFLGESGVGWIPYVLEQADFSWIRCRSWSHSPLKMLPSDYWKRQISGSFWYERIDSYIIDQLGADNILYEDDYPHMLTDNGIGKGSAGNIETSLQHVKDSKVRHKILAGNAMRLFGLGS